MDRNVETWQNATLGTVVIWRFDHRGALQDEVIRGGMKFQLSPEERMHNMEQSASAEQDNFKNGTLVPVKLIDGTEDAQEIASNPNLIGESDMKELFKAHWKTFTVTVEKINSLGTLQRMLEMSVEADATVRQSDVLKARIKELGPEVVEVTTEGTAPTASRAVGLSGRPI